MGRVIGMPWYRAEDYSRLRQIVSDPHAMASAFDAWLASAQNNEQVAKDAGFTVVRVLLEPLSFAAWCTERGLSPDGAARVRFASESANSPDPDASRAPLKEPLT
jgi:hypothetical protein